jgi:hypothetical protein
MPQSPHPFSSYHALLQCCSTKFHHFNNFTNATRKNDKTLVRKEDKNMVPSSLGAMCNA